MKLLDSSRRRHATIAQPRRIRLVALLLGALVVSGCWASSSRPDPVPVYPIDGRLFVGKKPAAGAVISFHPADGGSMVTATVHSDGRFAPAQADGALGLPEGAYTLTATWPDGEADRFGGRYADPSHPISKLTVRPGVNLIPPIKLP
ncbi:carboxypeptidase-like regulatory domain-containing protein [Aquisphaera insulae]|uniref:carboxypeptidase-like regulatory domain-containing protein n=1 Tax=Aquisphaera insulae TaxID=2712864 RepID=UPI0013EB9136|nr:carboxypeptidase-like regulatory domain-containing protein [Aquisphaera insulae]